MPLWGSVDNANNSVKFAGALAKLAPNTTNRDALFGNNTAVGVFAVDTAEIAASRNAAHAGWVLRTVGTGGRAGRVQTEVLVAMGSVTSDAEDIAYPDATIRISAHPAAANVTAPAAVTFTVAASATPNVALSYQWQANTGAGYSNLTNAGVYSNTATATLSISNSTGLNAARYRVLVSATGANTVTSNAALLTVA